MASWDDLSREFAGEDQIKEAKRRTDEVAQAQMIRAELPNTRLIDDVVQDFLHAMAAAGNPGAWVHYRSTGWFRQKSVLKWETSLGGPTAGLFFRTKTGSGYKVTIRTDGTWECFTDVVSDSDWTPPTCDLHCGRNAAGTVFTDGTPMDLEAARRLLGRLLHAHGVPLP